MQKKKGPKKGAKYNMERPYSFGKRLFELRKKRGLTQIELAEKMGTTLRGVSYYEREAKNPTIDVIEKAAKALGVPKKYFLDDNFKAEIQEVPPVIKSLKQRLPKLNHLPRKDQENLVGVIDGFLAKRKLAG